MVWLRSGGRGGLFGLLEFQGLEIDQVCKDDAFGYFASFREDRQLFGVVFGEVGINHYSFRNGLFGGCMCVAVVHIF